MGNLCTSSNTVPPTRPDLPREPPLVIAPSVEVSECVMESRAAALINLQQAAFETDKQGKHLVSLAFNERKKAANLVVSVGEKVKQFRSPEDRKEISVLDISSNTPVKTRRSEIQECITALENIQKTALSRTEEPLSAYVSRVERTEKETEEILDYVAECVATPSLPKTLVVKTGEMERSGTKIVSLLEGARKQLSEIDEHRAATSNSLSQAPELLEQLAELLRLEQDSESADIVIEDIEAYVSGPVEGEVAAEVEEMGSDDTRREVEVAAEAADASSHFCSIYDEGRENARMVERNVLRKLYAQHKNGLLKAFDEDAVCQLFGQLLVTKHAFDSLQETQPLSFDVFTVSFFHTEFQEAPMYALVQFLEGLKEMVVHQEPIGLFIASILGVFTASPYPQVVANQTAQMGQVLDRAIDTWEKVRWSDTSREAFASQPRLRLHTGGRMHLLDVLNLFAPILTEFPEYAGKFVEKLKPPLVKQFDFLHFLLVFKMRAMGRDGISLFKQISEDGLLTPEGLESGLRLSLNLHLSPQAADELFFYMRNSDDHTVRRLDFLRFLRLQTYLENERSDRFLLSKFQVLQAFTDVCVQRRRDLIAQLHASLKVVQPDESSITPETVATVLTAMGETRDLKCVLDSRESQFEELVWRLEQFGVKTCQKPYFIPEPERALRPSPLPAEVAVTVTS